MTSPISGKVAWSCPSNIAIVKYWGKHGRQLPRNASLSFTLKNAISGTTLAFSPKMGNTTTIVFRLDGIEKTAFGQKIEKYFNGLSAEMPFLSDYDFVIDSHNTFPHSSGIASSASGMAALAMCICEMENILKNNGDVIDWSKASTLARLGSGSASRSIFPIMAVWGKHPAFPGSDDEYAICIENEVHEIFTHFHDDILIVSDREKSVSSTAGHELMNTNVYAQSRYRQAEQNMKDLKDILTTGEVERFGELAESEALTLHALMMCSKPSYVLMLPATLEVIQRIRDFRKATNVPVYFTLDAGPNVHILYPHEVATQVQSFISSSLLPLAHMGQLLKDEVGKGPEKLML